MRILLSCLVLALGLCIFGCSSEASAEGTPKVQGKVEVKNAPEGATAPGDVRPPPSDSGKTKDAGERG